MSYRNPRPGAAMWVEALDLLDRAERLQRRFFRLGALRSETVWEPPVDITESAIFVEVVAALPGVTADKLRLGFDGQELVIEAFRPLPVFAVQAPGHKTLHQLEIPYGRFERRVALPIGRYELTEQTMQDGCLHLRFRKLP